MERSQRKNSTLKRAEVSSYTLVSTETSDEPSQISKLDYYREAATGNKEDDPENDRLMKCSRFQYKM
jgi:hypothetical protein